MPIKVARQLRSSHSSGKVKVYLFAEDGELLRFKSRLVQLAKRCCRWIARHETDVHRRRVASGERIARHYVPQLRRLAQDHSDVKFEPTGAQSPSVREGSSDLILFRST